VFKGPVYSLADILIDSRMNHYFGHDVTLSFWVSLQT
jgi:hypothetical protein